MSSAAGGLLSSSVPTPPPPPFLSQRDLVHSSLMETINQKMSILSSIRNSLPVNNANAAASAAAAAAAHHGAHHSPGYPIPPSTSYHHPPLPPRPQTAPRRHSGGRHFAHDKEGDATQGGGVGSYNHHQRSHSSKSNGSAGGSSSGGGVSRPGIRKHSSMSLKDQQMGTPEKSGHSGEGGENQHHHQHHQHHHRGQGMVRSPPATRGDPVGNRPSPQLQRHPSFPSHPRYENRQHIF